MGFNRLLAFTANNDNTGRWLMFFGWYVVAGTFIAQLVIVGFFTYSVSLLVPLVREEFAVTMEQVMYSLTAGTLIGILTMPLAGIMLDKMGRFKVITLSLLLLVGSYILLVAAPDPFAFWAIVPAMVLAGTGMSGTVAGTNTWVTDAASKEDVGTVLGGLNTMTAFSVLLFLGITGYLFDAFGPRAAFAFKGSIDLLLAIWLFAIKGKVDGESAGDKER